MVIRNRFLDLFSVRNRPFGWFNTLPGFRSFATRNLTENLGVRHVDVCAENRVLRSRLARLRVWQLKVRKTEACVSFKKFSRAAKYLRHIISES